MKLWLFGGSTACSEAQIVVAAETLMEARDLAGNHVFGFSRTEEEDLNAEVDGSSRVIWSHTCERCNH